MEWHIQCWTQRSGFVCLFKFSALFFFSRVPAFIKRRLEKYVLLFGNELPLSCYLSHKSIYAAAALLVLAQTFLRHFFSPSKWIFNKKTAFYPCEFRIKNFFYSLNKWFSLNYFTRPHSKPCFILNTTQAKLKVNA